MTERETEPPERAYEPVDWAPLYAHDHAADEAEQAARGYRPIQPEPAWRSLARKLAAPLVALAFLVWKFKAVVFAVFKLKIFTTAASMLVSVGAYALLGGWKFGVGLVLLIFVHEMGHVLELRRQGVPASAPMFIPFLGAFVAMKEMPKDAWREAQVALAGPIVGTAGAALVWAAGEAYDSNFLRAMAFVGFLINLFNLLPVVPLDGGRAVAALHPAMWLVGMAGLVALALYRPNPILFFIVVLGGLELWNRWHSRHDPAQADYYRVAPARRVAVATVYVGLAAFLAFGMDATHVPRDF
ncbi:MAG: site-2 protease family protein [Thermoleophilia bacterium]|nr:site-2 protease family protein [Thermoleophilia bacterium]